MSGKLLSYLLVLATCVPVNLFGGSGTTNLAIFEPVASTGVSTTTAEAVAEAMHAATVHQMDAFEVWGIELLTRESVTSTAIECLHTRAPAWNGEYPTAWKQLLNTNELITYGAVGTLTSSGHDSNASHVVAKYELVDFITSHTVSTLTASGNTPQQVGESLAKQLVASLQIYLSEIVRVDSQKVFLSLGPEAVSTGTVLACFAHGHAGPHTRDYPAHGHRDEEDHLLGSSVYARYFNTSAPLSTHTHAPMSPRTLMHTHLTSDALAATSQDFRTSAAKAQDPSALLQQAGMSNAPEPIRWAFLAHQFDGMRTGTIQIESFIQTRPYYHQFNAVGRILSGFAIPGGFVQLANSESNFANQNPPQPSN